MEEYVVVYTRRQQSHTEEYGVLHEGREAECIAENSSFKDNDAHEHEGNCAYMSAFRPSFCLNGSFAVTDDTDPCASAG